MNALKAHERHLAYLAEQERQIERERIEKMTSEEREQYEKKQAERRERLKDVYDTLAIAASIVPQTYR